MKSLNKFLLLSVIFISATYPQQDTEKSDNEIILNAVSRLQQKVLLSDKQVSYISSLLIRNIQELKESATSSAALNEAKKKVELEMDVRQKSKYDIIKDDWWNKLIKELTPERSG